MLNDRIDSRALRALRHAALATFATMASLPGLTLMCAECAAAPASARSVPPAADKSSRGSACKLDIQRYCSEANLKQECLVARWDKLSPACRNALGSSTGNRDDGS